MKLETAIDMPAYRVHHALQMLLLNVGRYVTKQPWTIDRTATLADAHRMMREHEVRHLPVLDRGKLVGIVTLHDLHLLESVADLSPEAAVEQAMSETPYVVAGTARLDDVTEAMADHKYSSAIIVNAEGAVEGVFTVQDVCRTMTHVLREIAL